jgi:hypothetical protein
LAAPQVPAATAPVPFDFERDARGAGPAAPFDFERELSTRMPIRAERGPRLDGDGLPPTAPFELGDAPDDGAEQTQSSAAPFDFERETTAHAA